MIAVGLYIICFLVSLHQVIVNKRLSKQKEEHVKGEFPKLIEKYKCGKSHKEEKKLKKEQKNMEVSKKYKK